MKNIFLITVVFLFPFTVGFSQSTDNTKPDSSYLPVRVTNTHISFNPPPGFVKSKNSRAFINKKNASSLILYEIPGISYELYRKKLDDAYFRSQNLRLVHSERTKFETQDGFLIECIYTVQDYTYNRLIFVTGKRNTTVLYVINYPEVVEEEVIQPIYKSISSIRYEVDP